MTTQSGGSSGENQLDIKLKYVSEGYQKHVRELQDLITLAKEMKTDLGSIRLPVIKGLKAALREAGELSTAIQSLNRQGSVQAVAPLPKNATKEQEAAYAEAKKIQAADTVVRQAQLEGGEKALKLQRQLANEAQNELHRKAFLGTLTKEEIKKQEGNLDHLKAIEKGLGESAKVGKKQRALQTEVSKLIEAEITQRKEAAQKQKADETRARLEQRKIAVKFARQSLEGNNKGLATYLKTADLNQIKALENAMKAESLKAGYTPTEHSKAFNEKVAKARADITAPKVTLKASDIVSKINAGIFTQAEVNHAVAQLRKQITHATNTGATRDTLVPLYQGLIDVRKAGAEKFKPVSPYQMAKESEEAYAKKLLATRFNSRSILDASKAEIENQLKASKILGHKTLAPFGSRAERRETAYQKFLQATLRQRVSETPEAEEARQRKKISSEKFQVSQNELKEAKKLLPLTREQLDKVTSQAEIEKHLHAIKVRGLKLGQDGYETEVQYRGQLKERLAAIRQEVAAEKKRLANPVAHEVSEYRKEIQATIQTPTQLNIARNAQRLSQKINLENAKHSALGTNKYTTKAALEALPVSELKTARDTLNYGLKQGLRLKPEVFKELIEYTKTLEKAEVKRIRKVEKEKENADKLAKIRADNSITQIKNEIRATDDLVKLKMLQRQLNTRLNAEVKANPKSSQVEAAERVKLELAQKIKNLGVATTGAAAQNRQTAAERAAQKARDDKAKADAFAQGRFNTQEQTKNLKGQELKFAADTLKFALGTGKVAEDQVKSVKEHLDVLQKRVREEARSNQQNQNLANLAHKYNTVAEIKNLKTKEEAELARKVVGYRMRTQQYDEQGLINQQKLLDAAKRQDQLLGSRDKRQDKDVQQEKRLTQLTHLEGDGGAAMAVIQTGFMMRSQVLGGLGSIFSGAFDSAIQLDKAFRNLQAISASTNYEMATMKINLINVAQASKFSAAEVGETAVMLAQAGLSIQEIGASMKGIITLAQATGTDLAKSVDVVTSVLSIFNKSATETDTIVNQLTAALNESKLDINKMALGLQYAGNIANDSGVSFEELTAALGATANAGIRSGSTLGTGLRQMFIDLQKPSEKLSKRLETLGITLDQVNFRSQGLEGVLRNLRNAGFSSADAFETFEVRSAAAFSALSGNLTDFHNLQEELADTNAAFDANNVQMEAFAVQLDHLKSNLGVLAAEGLKPVTAMLRDWTKGLAHSMENAEEGAGTIQLLTSAFAALMVGVTVTWFTRLAWEIGKLTLAMGGLRALSGATTFGVLGIVAALGTGIASWISYRSEVERLNTALDKAKGEHNSLKAALQSSEGTLNNVDEALKNLVDRYGVLKEDSGQTQTAAKNLMAQFEEFGLKIDDVANISIDNLIQKIQDLRSELSKDLKEKISDTATAKVKEILTEKSTAQGKLKQAKVFSGYFDFTSEGYKKFEQATNPSGSDPLGMSAFGRSPEFRKLYLQFFQGALRTQRAGKMLPPSEFSAPELKAKMQDLLAKSPNLSSTDIRILQEALDDLSLNYEDIRTVNTAQERISKTRKQQERDLYTLESDDFSKSAFGGEGRSSAVARNFSETLNKLTKIKDPRTRRKEQAIAAEQALKDSQAIISEAENELKTLEANKADSHQILTKQGQIARMREAEFEYRKYIKENDAQERKRQLQVLGFDLDAAKDAVATAKAIWSKSTGLNTEEKTYKEYEAKILAQQEIEDRINALRLIDNPDEATALAAVKRSRTSEKTKRGVERNSFRKNIEDTAAKAAVDTQEARSRQALEDKKREQDRFFKELENKDKFVKMQEEAERRQAKAKAYIPLDSGSMFDTLNADEKKAAQAKANATGVSQEYSIFGQASNRFARQAARFDNQQLEKNLIQRKLANEVGNLALLQQKERNINQEDYAKLVEKEVRLKAELKALEDRAANSRLDQDKEALERKQKEYDLTRDEILAAQNYEETLKEKIEERKNSIEALKETLQALNDQYDLMDTTLTAGVQSMTSGLSSIFSDWASGVIKNTDDVKEAFRSLGQSVLQSMAKVVSDKIAQQFMGFLLNGLGSAFGVGTGEVNLGVSTGLGEVSLGASTGGLITPTGVKHFARGGEVTGTNIGRDSVPAYLQPNEYVIQRSAVQALGTPFLQQLNNITTGSLKQGASALGTAKPMVQNVMKSSPPVNVYVVSPEQQRQMGQEDVVVALQDDILRGGTTKKLIKAVIAGEV
jgi:TP901 family phage tail tape measure protein